MFPRLKTEYAWGTCCISYDVPECIWMYMITSHSGETACCRNWNPCCGYWCHNFIFKDVFCSIHCELMFSCICVCIIKGSTDQIAHSLLKSQLLGRKENILQVVCQWGCIRKWNNTMFFPFLESDFFVSLSHRFEKYGNKLLCYEVTKMWSLRRNFVIHARNLCSLLRTCCLALGYKDKWALSCLWFCSKCLSPLDEKLLGLVLFANFGIETLGGGRGFFSLFFSRSSPVDGCHPT